MGMRSQFMESGGAPLSAATIEKIRREKRLQDAQDVEAAKWQRRGPDNFGQVSQTPDPAQPVVDKRTGIVDLSYVDKPSADLSGKGDTGGGDVGASNNQYAAAATALQASGATKVGGLGGIAAAGAAGALAGAPGGPGMAAVTSGVAITGALLSQKAEKAAARRATEAAKFRNLAAIESDTEIKRQNAMTGMVTALRSAFLGGSSESKS